MIQARANALGPNLRVFITTHTAANMYLHPFGNTEEDSFNCERSTDHDAQVPHQLDTTVKFQAAFFSKNEFFLFSSKWRNKLRWRRWQSMTLTGLTETRAKRFVSHLDSVGSFNPTYVPLGSDEVIIFCPFGPCDQIFFT